MLKSYDVFLDIVESALLCSPKTQIATDETEPYYLLSFEEKLFLVCIKISNI